MNRTLGALIFVVVVIIAVGLVRNIIHYRNHPTPTPTPQELTAMTANEQAIRAAKPGDLLAWSDGEKLTQVLVVDGFIRVEGRYIEATPLTKVSNQRSWDIEEFAATPVHVVPKGTPQYDAVLGAWVPEHF